MKKILFFLLISNVALGQQFEQVRLSKSASREDTTTGVGASVGYVLTFQGFGSKPTWAAGGSVSSFSSGNLSPLFTTSVATPTTIPALSFVLSNAASFTILGNNTSTGNPPTYFAPILASQLFSNQGTTTTVLHGNASGNPSWGAVILTTDVSGVLPPANGGTNLKYTNSASLTISATTTITQDSSHAASYFSTSNRTTVTFAYTGLIDHTSIDIDYQKTTASNCVVTFPTGTVIYGTGATSVVSPNCTLVSTASGRYLFHFYNINGVYSVDIKSTVP